MRVPTVFAVVGPQRAAVAALASLGAAAPLAGCSTTMQEAARLQLNSARIRASQEVTRVSASPVSGAVRVARVTVITAGGRIAFAVLVRNDSRRAVSDLPISVGYRVGSTSEYLNASADLSYYQAHLPVITAGGSLTWVFTSGAAQPAALGATQPAGSRPFARVGATPSVRATPISRLPRLLSAASRTRGPVWDAGADGVSVRLRNASGVPQYQLPVYVLARRGGRLIGAGETVLAHLGTGSTRTLKVPVLGRTGQAALEVETPPTIFQ